MLLLRWVDDSSVWTSSGGGELALIWVVVLIQTDKNVTQVALSTFISHTVDLELVDDTLAESLNEGRLDIIESVGLAVGWSDTSIRQVVIDSVDILAQHNDEGEEIGRILIVRSDGFDLGSNLRIHVSGLTVVSSPTGTVLGPFVVQELGLTGVQTRPVVRKSALQTGWQVVPVSWSVGTEEWMLSVVSVWPESMKIPGTSDGVVFNAVLELADGASPFKSKSIVVIVSLLRRWLLWFLWLLASLEKRRSTDTVDFLDERSSDSEGD
jgi:hypothetical protein